MKGIFSHRCKEGQSAVGLKRVKKKELMSVGEKKSNQSDGDEKKGKRLDFFIADERSVTEEKMFSLIS